MGSGGPVGPGSKSCLGGESGKGGTIIGQGGRVVSNVKLSEIVSFTGVLKRNKSRPVRDF